MFKTVKLVATANLVQLLLAYSSELTNIYFHIFHHNLLCSLDPPNQRTLFLRGWPYTSEEINYKDCSLKN